MSNMRTPSKTSSARVKRQRLSLSRVPRPPRLRRQSAIEASGNSAFPPPSSGVRNYNSVDMGLGFPKTVKMAHRYYQTFDLGNIGGAVARAQFVCNGMYDPDVAVGGHQPLYFDQMSGVYDHYTVIASRITLTMNQASTGNTSASVALWINDDTTATPTLTALQEQSSASIGVLSPINANPLVLTKAWSAKKAFGGSVLGNDNLQGSASANPAEVQVFDISVWPQNLTSTQSYNCQVLIEFIAVWDEIRDVGTS